MKVPINWIKEFVDYQCAADDFAKLLTLGGMEIEGIEKCGKETIFEIPMTPNRGDWLSIEGIAREVSVLTGKKIKLVKVPSIKGKKKIKNFLSVEVKSDSGCYRYSARVIDGVKIKESPGWLKTKLENSGVRPINNVVDATNYVMIEMGQPLHAFDYRFIQNEKIVVQHAKQSQKFVTLDEVERSLEKNDILICDGEKPVALGGIMGGLNSQIQNDTEKIILESAWFEPWKVRSTSKRLGLMSESSRRFERGADVENVTRALNRVVGLIVELAGGVATEDWIDVYPKKIKPKKISLKEGEIESILGMDFKKGEIDKVLKSLGFVVSNKGKNKTVIVPSWRVDVENSVSDLAEDVARVAGYHKIPETMPRMLMSSKHHDQDEDHIKPAISALLDYGFSEAVLLSFTNPEECKRFGLQDFAPALSNPLNANLSVMMPSLLPGLTNAVVYNINHQTSNVRLFSRQKVFNLVNGDISESNKIGFVLSGRKNPVGWNDQRADVDFYSAKKAVEAICQSMSVLDLNFSEDDIPHYVLSGRAASVMVEGENIGFVGQLDPKVCAKFEIDADVYVSELDEDFLHSVQKRAITSRKYKAISKYPFIERDVALMVKDDVSSFKIINHVRNACLPLVKGIELFDVYKGKGVDSGMKSLAFTITYGDENKTLTDENVNVEHEKLIKILSDDLGATLRS